MVRYMVLASRWAKYAPISMCIAATPYGVDDEVMSGSAPDKEVPKEFSRSMPTHQTAAKATTDQSIELRISLEPVAPMYIPSHVKAAHPTTGIRTSQGRNVTEASITAASEVIILRSDIPPK
mgnify:FL=1